MCSYSARAAIEAINQPRIEAKIAGCPYGYICYFLTSICLAALEKAASSGAQTQDEGQLRPSRHREAGDSSPPSWFLVMENIHPLTGSFLI